MRPRGGLTEYTIQRILLNFLKGVDLKIFALTLFLCIFAAAATPYIVLKLGMSTDLSFGAMFLIAGVFGRRLKGREMAIQLNIAQTMINAVTSIGFMCVVLGAFTIIQKDQDIGFHPTWWQLALWVSFSSALGAFLGPLLQRFVLSDKTLPWPSARAVSSLVETLSSEEAAEESGRQRALLSAGTTLVAFLTYLRDGLGVLPTVIAKAGVAIMFQPEFAAIGVGLLVPLGVGLSGMIGVWGISTFGEHVSGLAALSGAPQGMLAQCHVALNALNDSATSADDKAAATALLTNACGANMSHWMGSPSHFGFVIKWMMWPATSMMIASSLTSVLFSLLRSLLRKSEAAAGSEEANESQADEYISPWFTWTGLAICFAALTWIQSSWFHMSLWQTVLVFMMQPLLAIAGLRVMGVTGNGPVSLMANATQFVFGLLFPSHILQNLAAAQMSADPQASSEGTVGSFRVAKQIGGAFKTLVTTELFAIPVGAIMLPFTFTWLIATYGIGPEPGQLGAPTSQKIAALALVMQQGISAMPTGAITASIVAAVVGIVLELGLLVTVKDRDGEVRQRFGWLPVPAALGFGLILPPTVTIGMALGSVISYAWRRMAEAQGSRSFETYMNPTAVSLIAGEALVGAILIPALTTFASVLGY